MKVGRVVVTMLVALCALALTPAAQARVPQGWVGSMFDGPLSSPLYNVENETGLMVKSGVESVRTVFYWYNAQPYERWDYVAPDQQDDFHDVGGVATSFRETDLIVARALRRKFEILPVIYGTPKWMRTNPADGSPPRDPAMFANYMTGLVQRYGPNGSFWEEHWLWPKQPIRTWQLWNEPDFKQNWRGQDWRAGYPKLLKAGYDAIKAADPGATVVLSGFANDSYRSLAKFYAAKGPEQSFDQVALHPYTSKPKGVLELVKRARRVMSRAGDGDKSVLLTEFGWPSSGKKRYGFETTMRGQAKRLRKALPLLARHRKRLKIDGVYYYTWLRDREPRKSGDSFDHAGLRRFTPNRKKVVSKPALRVLRRIALKLEGCKRKGDVATECVKRR